MHKKAGNLFSEWALALRRSIGEPAPLPPQQPSASSTPVPAPPNTPALALKKAASTASKSTGEQTKRQAETAETVDTAGGSDTDKGCLTQESFFNLVFFLLRNQEDHYLELFRLQ